MTERMSERMTEICPWCKNWEFHSPTCMARTPPEWKTKTGLSQHIEIDATYTKVYEGWVIEESHRFPCVTRPVDHPTGLPPNAIGLALGLAGESGEIADAIKKIVRDKHALDVSSKRRQNVLLELGDALWYLTALADSFGWTLQDVMQANMDKINKRRAEERAKNNPSDKK